jgi:DNA-binding response OmpR family regulator
MTKPKTIAIIDDEENIVDVVKSYLENSGYKVVYAYSGGDAMALIDKYVPSLIILDLMLPDISGEDLCRAIRKKSRVPIIFSPRQLMARVDALLRRVSEEPVPLFSEISMNDGELVADILRHEIRKNGKPVALTPDEYNILMVMLKYPTKVFTRDELIDFALDDEFDGFDRIIDTHIKNIRQKIENDPKSPRYVQTVHGVGYKFGGELDEN